MLLSPAITKSQCVIDTTINDAIVPPAGSRFDTLPNSDVIVILPYATVGQNYSEALQFKVPTDTTFGPVMGTVDSIIVVSITH